MSTLVKSIHIHQYYVSEIANGSRYFFGQEDFNVARLFLKMLSNKLDKLSIVNTCYPQYLSKNCAEMLKDVRLIIVIFFVLS